MGMWLILVEFIISKCLKRNKMNTEKFEVGDCLRPETATTGCAIIVKADPLADRYTIFTDFGNIVDGCDFAYLSNYEVMQNKDVFVWMNDRNELISEQVRYAMENKII